jgi:Putative peptidoglycan binding domain/Resolvase, N terminal domain
MSSHPFRNRTGTPTKAAIALALAAAAAIVVPAAANAASKHARKQTKAVLAEGIGMRAKPSVRVRELQRTLARHGYSIGKSGVDGRFGPRTRAAVRRLQRRHHLKVDGIVGPRTRAALRIDRRSHRSTGKHRRAHSTKRAATSAATAATAAATAATPAATAPTPVATAPEPTPGTTPARTPAATNPTSVRLTTSHSISPLLILGPLVVLITALFTLAHMRQRRRHEARIAAYHLGTFVPPELQQSDEPVVPAPEERPAAPASTPAPAARSAPPFGNGARVIGYVTERPASARTPEQDIERACERSGWQVVEIVRDGGNGSILERPGMTRALERIRAGEAQGLVVRDARPLSRSADFATFVRWFRDADATLIALDLGLDTSTPEGRRLASALITMNGWTGDWIASKTGRSLAETQANSGEPPHSNGDALSHVNGGGAAHASEEGPAHSDGAGGSNGGSPPQSNGGGPPRLTGSEREQVLARIARLCEDNMAVQEIADLLNEEDVPTLFGTHKWWPSTVQAAIRYGRAPSAAELEHLPATERRANA